MEADGTAAGEYRRLDIKQYAPRSIRETAENKFWKKFKAPVIAKQVRRRAEHVAVPASAPSRARGAARASLLEVFDAAAGCAPLMAPPPPRADLPPSHPRCCRSSDPSAT